MGNEAYLEKTSEKENHLLQIKLTKTQKARLQNLAESSGYGTLSAFVRAQCLNPSTELKLNKILQILERKNGN